MEAAAIAMIITGVYLMYSSVQDWNPFETAKQSLNKGVPTIVKYGG